MFLIEVSKAKYLRNYQIELLFDTGESKVVDLKDTIFKDHRKIFFPLREIDYFKRFNIKFNTIEWPNELDLAPEYLYELSDKQIKRPLTSDKKT